MKINPVQMAAWWWAQISHLKKKYFAIAIEFVVLITFSLFLVFYSDNTRRDLPEIVQSGRLMVLTDDSQMGFHVEKDSVCGFQYELIKAFADSLGVELVMTRNNDVEKCRKYLKNGEYDIIANMLPVTSDWNGDVAFTEALNVTRQILVQRMESDSMKARHMARRCLDLANDTIYIPYNSPYKMRLQNLSDEIAQPLHIIEMKNTTVDILVKRVSEGKIKYTICDEDFAENLSRKYQNLDVSLPVGFEHKQAWAVQKDSKLLLNKLNDFLNDFVGSSEYWKIYKKYY